MTTITSFCFGPFQENTYIITHESKDCWIIDPGCYTDAEKNELTNYIDSQGLRPVRLLNTHCHLDHIFGNELLKERYGLKLAIHPLEIPVLEMAPQISRMFGVHLPPQQAADIFLEENDVLALHDAKFEILFAPGHSPGSICFYNRQEGYIISGDVLFQGSIGRTDLPGGNYATLINSIQTKLFTLDDETEVYSGHGAVTKIGFEKRYNPFFNLEG